MLARSFLIKSSSTFLITRTGIKAWSSLNLGQIRLLILELLVLEWWKFHTFELEYLWSQLANLDQILCVASLGWGKGCIRFWASLTLAHWTQVSDRCPLGYLFKSLLFCVSDGNWQYVPSWRGRSSSACWTTNTTRYSKSSTSALWNASYSWTCMTIRLKKFLGWALWGLSGCLC